VEKGRVDSSSGMTAVPHEHGLALLVAHCATFDPDALTVRERLDAALGPELAHKLLFALAGTERGRRGLRARTSFAA
jgi:hypothetical protein